MLKKKRKCAGDELLRQVAVVEESLLETGVKDSHLECMRAPAKVRRWFAMATEAKTQGTTDLDRQGRHVGSERRRWKKKLNFTRVG